jgi:aminoglycoside phosphotransferase (APT) family kinase protein
MDNAKEVREGEALDWVKLEQYLRAEIPELSGEFKVQQFHGGHANLTYLLNFGNQELVLRRPPFGKIAPGAHDMKREYRVLSKLYKFFPQAPRAFHLCEDPAIIGAKFVLMERRRGVILRYEMLDCFKEFENAAERLTVSMIKAQATLHQIDVVAADLNQLGKPKGFVERQLNGWAKRWELSKAEENQAMEEVLQALKEAIPQPQAVSIIHNDIKFDNCQFQENNPDEVSSIFDWDMTTLGDPLIDFATTLSYWPDQRIKHIKNLPVQLKGNFPSKDFLKEKYQAFTGFSLENIAWYEAFSYWKGAIIAQQLYKRFLDGATKDKRMESFGNSAKAMGMLALQIIK